MKRIKTAFGLLAVVAFAAFLSSCASTTSNAQIDESVAINAGFKTITPKTAGQKSQLAKLPVDQMTPVTHGGKQYYIIPNLTRTQAYVGGPKQFDRYRELQLGEAINDENILNSELVGLDDGIAWDEWSGWGTWPSTGWY